MLPPQAAARRGRRTFGPSDGFRVPGKSLSQALSESLSPSLAFSWAPRAGPARARGRRRAARSLSPGGSRFFFCRCAKLRHSQCGSREGERVSASGLAAACDCARMEAEPLLASRDDKHDSLIQVPSAPPPSTPPSRPLARPGAALPCAAPWRGN